MYIGIYYFVSFFEYCVVKQIKGIFLFLVQVIQSQGNYFGAVMSLAAFVMDCDTETASKEVEAHLENGGELNDFAPLFDMVTESDFFRSLSKQQASKA